MEWAAGGAGPATAKSPLPPPVPRRPHVPLKTMPRAAAAGRAAGQSRAGPIRPRVVALGPAPRTRRRWPGSPHAASAPRRGSAAEWDFIPSEDLVQAPAPSRRGKLSSRLRRSPKPEPEETDDDAGPPAGGWRAPADKPPSTPARGPLIHPPLRWAHGHRPENWAPPADARQLRRPFGPQQSKLRGGAARSRPASSP